MYQKTRDSRDDRRTYNESSDVSVVDDDTPYKKEEDEEETKKMKRRNSAPQGEKRKSKQERRDSDPQSTEPFSLGNINEPKQSARKTSEEEFVIPNSVKPLLP